MHRLITTSEGVVELCEKLKDQPYITVDTEFIRERTYYSQLCLIQISAPCGVEAAIDPLAEGIDLTPFYAILNDAPMRKVFHAAKQDLEIFYHLTGKIPHPIFDTQVAAMVCGYGEQVGYEALVNKICKEKLDKSSRYSDWAQRPLSQKQLNYAISDVTHLRTIYETLDEKVKQAGRAHWIDEEMAILESPKTYEMDPEGAWKRIKLRKRDRINMQLLRALAGWREQLAESKDKPRGRILRDEVLAQLAEINPKSLEDMQQARGLNGRISNNQMAELFDVIDAARNEPEENYPPLPKRPKNLKARQEVMLDALKLLLKWEAADNDVAPRLVAGKEDLTALVLGEEEDKIACLHGWRREVYGQYALDFLAGKVNFHCENGRLVIKAD